MDDDPFHDWFNGDVSQGGSSTCGLTQEFNSRLTICTPENSLPESLPPPETPKTTRAIKRRQRLSLLDVTPPSRKKFRRSLEPPTDPRLFSACVTPPGGSSIPLWEPEIHRSVSQSSDCIAVSSTRYHTDFEDLGDLGHGSFGRVSKVLKRTDQMTYAVKRMTAKGDADKEIRMREVRALAQCTHPHIVRYFDSWVEDDDIYLRTEFCSEGTIRQQPVAHWSALHFAQLRKMLREIASALAYLHRLEMAHMDVKGANIYIASDGSHRLGDFGLVVSLKPNRRDGPHSPTRRSTSFDLPTTPLTQISMVFPVSQDSQASFASLEEGDSRYLASEVLHDRTNLPAADVFSLGITALELATGDDLPTGGEPWQSLRRGEVPPVPDMDWELMTLINSMMHPNPVERPLARTILS